MPSAIEGYLSQLHEIHSSGSAVDETSYYGALETLLNEVGRQLKPKVRCILNPRNRGAGIPDGGLFAAALLHAPAYLTENAGALRQDWPRVPLPADREALLASAALGRQVAALLDVETPVPGVTSGAPRAELRPLGVVTRASGSPGGDVDRGVTAGWGHPGQGGITMPGQGRIVPRDYTAEELAALEEGGRALGLSFAQMLRLLGESTSDVYLNETVYWKNVPARVWGYTLGGYQVVKKWLSYREADLLGRSLRPDEARHVTEMVRRIAALLLMEPGLDASYEAIKAAPFPWPPSPPAP